MMSLHSLQHTLNELNKVNDLLIIQEEVDPHLEMAEIHRRINEKGGPAILFEKVKGSSFRACSNIFGTKQRCNFLFQDALRNFDLLIKLKTDPLHLFKHPLNGIKALKYAIHSIPNHSKFQRPILFGSCSLSDLPQIVSWPKDGGAFITLPQVISFPPTSTECKDANIGMYRIQISGNDYLKNKEAGLHYQIHRGIGIHHSLYNKSDKPFKISIGIGGPPAHTLASIFPLPEDLSEILFTGILGHRRYRYFWKNGYFIPSDVDFCITGIVDPNNLKPEGPFGDHLGYYSLKHLFPYFQVQKIYHKKDPIWHFTVVGRPPQEDSQFGYLIHQLTKELGSIEYPGIKSLHAVDSAGVHPLLLAIGSERYMPFRDQKPEELLTQANHLLGKGQTSLSKYLIISTNHDNLNLDVKDVKNFLQYVLERIDLSKDLHFYTNTTIDTLDYSGTSLNAGSKLVIACNRIKLRTLEANNIIAHEFNSNIAKSQIIQPGILGIQLNENLNQTNSELEIENLSVYLKSKELSGIPLIVIVDDLDFVLKSYNNFIWVTFTRSNPAKDIYGVNSFIEYKHWGCRGSMIIDARSKIHHAPTLEVDPDVSRKVDQMFSRSKILSEFL